MMPPTPTRTHRSTIGTSLSAVAAMTADRVVRGDSPVDRDDAIEYVLDDWCHITMDAVEQIGESFLLEVTFRDDADGTCIDGPPHLELNGDRAPATARSPESPDGRHGTMAA